MWLKLTHWKLTAAMIKVSCPGLQDSRTEAPNSVKSTALVIKSSPLTIMEKVSLNVSAHLPDYTAS
jgi:hypothetical protein